MQLIVAFAIVVGVKKYRQSRPFHRFVRRMAATRLMAKVYGVIQEPIDRLVYRLTRGTTTASSFLGGVEITMLTTTGARTGRTSTLPVLGVPDGDDTILVASNYGRPRNPAWYHNLRANPHARITVHGVSREVVARELSGHERELSYRRAEEIYPGFTHYPRWTEGREIPVLRLKPLA
jgi:deazaflavin-dependent oxidoreductase (nitroreductase family)